MKQKENIQEELKELNSSLVTTSTQAIYTVPATYFESLAATVMARVKAIDAASSAEELQLVSSFLYNVSKELPYQVPSGYFEQLNEKVKQSMSAADQFQTPSAELEALSPLLGSVSKQMPFSVPSNYFENLASTSSASNSKPAAKVIKLTSHKWFKIAAAALVTGIIATASFVYLKQEKIDVNTDAHAWVKKNIKKVSTDKLNEFIELADEEKLVDNALVTVDKKNQIKELVQDIPAVDIQNFLNDIEIADDPAADELLMN